MTTEELKNSSFSKDYNENDFFTKIKNNFKKIPFLKEVLVMYYCLMDASTPIWVKTLIIAALGYFISPIDAIPDMILFVGYTDDAAVLTMVMGTITMYIQDKHHKQAEEWLGINH